MPHPSLRRFAVAAVAATVLATGGVAVAARPLPSGPRSAGALRPPPVGRTYPISPYADARFLLGDPQGPSLSAYAQPWRGYLETRSGRDLAAGVGVNYNVPADADHEAVVGLLASVGVRHLRLEVPFSAIAWSGELKQTEAYVLRAVTSAAKRHGIRPLVLLNGHAGAPGPHTSVTRRLVTAAPRGSRTILLDDVSGLEPGRSGLSNLTEYWMAEALVTRTDPLTGLVTLSRPLPVDLPAGPVQLDTMKYAPLHPAWTARFDASANGWLAYASTVLDALAANGIADFDVEIWNELASARQWLQVDDYYDPPLHDFGLPDFLNRGGTAWELASRTTALVKSRAPRSRVVWGFSNTTFLHTQPAAMPRGVDGESYHPYGTGVEQYPKGLPGGSWERNYVPSVRKVMPEGWAHLGTRHEQLPRPRLAPNVRNAGPPGTTRYQHFLTEHGIAPRDVGVTDETAAQHLKAAVAVRSLGFWMNKGIDVVDLFAAYDRDPAGYGLLRSDVEPRDYGRYTREQLLTPSLRALAGFTAPLAGATAVTPTQLTVAAASYGPQPVAFPGQPYREMLALLPFQVSADRFVVGSYVMSYDVTRPPPSMRFRVTFGRLPDRAVRASLLDPLTGRTTPVTSYRTATGELTVDLGLDQQFRWLVLDLS